MKTKMGFGSAIRSDLSGQRFSRLVVVGWVPGTHGRRGAWRVHCDCGATKTVESTPLKGGLVKSCGCLGRDLRAQGVGYKHGHTSRSGRSATYISWQSMWGRCTDPRRKSWKDYGGRGITVSERWRDFAEFLADMGERPAGMTIDRKDHDGNYEPGNCRWATASQQARNTRLTAETRRATAKKIWASHGPAGRARRIRRAAQGRWKTS